MKNLLQDILYVFKNIFSLFSHIKKKQAEEREHMLLLDNVFIYKETYDHIIINDVFLQFIDVVIYTDSNNICTMLTAQYSRFILFFSIIKADREESVSALKKKISDLYLEKLSNQQKGLFINAVYDEQIKKAEALMAYYLSGEQAYLVKAYLSLDYELHTKKLRVLSSLYHIQFYPLYFKQLQGLKNLFTTPTSLKHYDLLQKTNAINPFSSPYITRAKGIFIGREMNTNVPVFEDMFSSENFNSVIIAKSGAGKSFLASLLIKRLIFSGVKVMLIDPENECTPLVEAMHGITLDHTDAYQLDSLMYTQANQSYINDIFPKIEHFKNVSYASIENIDEADFIRYTPGMDVDVLSLQRILSYCLNRQAGKTILVIDEAHKVMDDENIAQYIRQMAKRGRKYHVGICIISQDIIDFVQNKWSKAVLSNATYKFLLKQEAIAIPLVNKVFALEGYDEFLKQVHVGQGLFIKGDVRRKLYFDPV